MVSLKDYFDKPFAGPGTKIAYETALGRFLVAFNRVENAVRILIKLSLKEIDREDFWLEIRSNELLVQLKNLQMISLSVQGLPALPYETIKTLNATRNVLAHGHYSQDFFSDDFKIVGKTKDSLISLEEIGAATILAEDTVYELESAMAIFWQDDVAYDTETEMLDPDPDSLT